MAKRDKKDGKEYEVNWYADTAMTVIFIVQIFALLRHCQQRSKSEGDEYVLAQMVAGIIVLVCIIMMCKRIARSIGTWISSTFNPIEDPMSNPVLLSRFADQFWQLVVHVSMTIFELAILSETNYSWLYNPDESWIPPPSRQAVNPTIEAFYQTQLCIWVATGLSHKFVDERNKDYYVMYIHHIATLGLVFGSWTCNYTRIGVLVLFVHDSSDIAIDMLKLTNHLKLHERKFFYICETCFVSTIITWAWARGWYLGTMLLPSAAFGSVRGILKGEYKFPGLKDKYDQYEWTQFKSDEEIDALTHDQLIQVGTLFYEYYTAMNLLLVAILTMNIYWYCLILKILLGKCKGERSADMANRVYTHLEREKEKEKNKNK